MTNVEKQYLDAVKAAVVGGQINMMCRMKLYKLQKELGLAEDAARGIEAKVVSESAAATAAQASKSAELAVAKAKENAEREERKRLVELERQQEEARREAQRLEEARRRAEEEAKRERERAEEARKQREVEELKDRERREKEHQRQLAEQERLRKASEKEHQLRFAEQECLRKEAEKAANEKLAAERAMREAAEARAAAEVARKEAELSARNAEVDRLKVQSQKSSANRTVYVIIGLLFGWLGLHFAYAKRWVLFLLIWVSWTGLIVGANLSPRGNAVEPSGDQQATKPQINATEKAADEAGFGWYDWIAIAGIFGILILWLGGAMCVGKDGKGLKM